MKIFLLLAPLVFACSAPAQSAPTPCTPCQQPTLQAAPSSAATARSEELDALAERRVELLSKSLATTEAQYRAGAASMETLMQAERDIALAARDGLRGEKRRHELERYRAAMNTASGAMKQRYDSAKVTEAELHRVEAALAEAEYWLLEATEAR
jgi:outer membrane protein TolC